MTKTKFSSALGASRSLLDERAGDLCAKGYTILDDKLERTGDDRITSWQIRCKRCASSAG